MRFVPQQFFPSSDRPELLVDLQLPENASIYATRDVSARLDTLLKGDQDVDHWSTYVGRGAVRFYLPLNVQLPNDFFGQAVVVTEGLEQRERVKAKLQRALAADFPTVVGRVYPLELGPPVVAAPIPGERARSGAGAHHRLAGGRARRLGPWSRERQLQLDGAARTIKIQVDQDQARLLGLISQELALAVNAVVSASPPPRCAAGFGSSMS